MPAPTKPSGHARRLLPLGLIAVLALPACGRSDAEHGEAAGGTATMPSVTAVQAGDAVSDAMLIASRALYLALGSAESSREVRSDDGLLVLTRSDDADVLSGSGSYRIELDGYAIPPDDPFSDHYHGYSFSGSVELGSTPANGTRTVFDLDATHADSERYPVRRLELEMSRKAGDERAATAAARVNGTGFAFGDLAAVPVPRAEER